MYIRNSIMKNPDKVLELLRKGDYFGLLQLTTYEMIDKASTEVSGCSRRDKESLEEIARKRMQGEFGPISELLPGEKEYNLIEWQFNCVDRALAELCILKFQSKVAVGTLELAKIRNTALGWRFISHRENFKRGIYDSRLWHHDLAFELAKIYMSLISPITVTERELSDFLYSIDDGVEKIGFI